MITDEMRAEFSRQGFVIVPGVLTGGQLRKAHEMVAALLKREPFPAGHAGPYFLWPTATFAGE
jgi:hypothetical protein